MKNYLKIEVGSRGEIEEVKWFNNKTFEEIVEIGKKEFEDSNDNIEEETRPADANESFHSEIP